MKTGSRPWKLLVILIFFFGCAGKYSVRSMQPRAILQWPFQPAAAKVTYVEAFQGFARGGGSPVLRAIAGGSEKQPGLFLLPVAISTGSDGRIAVADIGSNCVHLFIPERKQYTCIPGHKREPFRSPVGVVFDEDLRLYVSDSGGKVVVFGPDASFVSLWEKAGSEALKRPTGIAYSPAKKLLYVVDTLQNKVNAFQKNGVLAFSFGKRGDQNGEFNFPTHISISSAGTLYVTDALNFRIQVFDESGTYLNQFGHHGDGSGDLAMPKGVAVDRDGVVYVVDSLFDNVQLFSPNGDFLLTVGGRGLDYGQFWLPSGIHIDARNTMYICDTYNRRIQVFRVAENYS